MRPLTGCRLPVGPGRAKLQFKDGLYDETHDKLTWKWTRGDETPLEAFGDPRTSEGYVLCAYDESAAPTDVFFRAIVPAAAACGGAPCWRSLGAKGFAYKDKTDVRPEGVRAIKLIPGASGKAKIVVKGGGRVLSRRPFGLPDVPPTPFPVPFRVQLEASNGECWEAVYSAVRKSENGFAKNVFKATSD